MEASFSLDKVKNAVWSYGNDKAPGLDGFGFTVKFLKEFWDVLKVDVFRYLKDFEDTGLIKVGYLGSGD